MFICFPAKFSIDAYPKGFLDLNDERVAEKLKSSSPKLPIIMISAYSEKEDIKRAQQKGLLSYCLTKPFDINEVIDSLHYIFELKLSNTM